MAIRGSYVQIVWIYTSHFGAVNSNITPTVFFLREIDGFEQEDSVGLKENFLQLFMNNTH